MMRSLEPPLSAFDAIVPDELYDVAIISAPIFDRNGEVTLSLSLRGSQENHRINDRKICSPFDAVLRNGHARRTLEPLVHGSVLSKGP